MCLKAILAAALDANLRAANAFSSLIPATLGVPVGTWTTRGSPAHRAPDVPTPANILGACGPTSCGAGFPPTSIRAYCVDRLFEGEAPNTVPTRLDQAMKFAGIGVLIALAVIRLAYHTSPADRIEAVGR